jgi:hypothetical protein
MIETDVGLLGVVVLAAGVMPALGHDVGEVAHAHLDAARRVIAGGSSMRRSTSHRVTTAAVSSHSTVPSCAATGRRVGDVAHRQLPVVQRRSPPCGG